MKIITLHKPVNADSLYNHLQQNINPLFKKQRQQEVNFIITKNGDAIDIAEPELYDDVLYHIEIKNDQLHITRNEHYTDDVNSLTLESILNSMFENISGKGGTDLVREG
jgi:hypothetical protein